jgi:hypothetical protein
MSVKTDPLPTSVSSVIGFPAGVGDAFHNR